MSIKNLSPEKVWNNFYELTQIPRPSKKEGKVSEYLYNWGKSHGLETIRDEAGNVIIRKTATPGYENRKGVVLQGHMDMVPQKNADVEHDFDKDPIEAYVDGEYVRAKGTTLGADNGIGVSLALSVLESDDLKHGPLELLITVDEETGMTGAFALKPNVLKGDILINLDSETEGELYVGCAGGIDANAACDYPEVDIPVGYKVYDIAAKGFKGGHSGMDIILCRANANKAAARVLYALITKADAKVIYAEGGTLRNAIPRECFATVAVPDEAKAKEVFDAVAAVIKSEYAGTDPDCEFIFAPSTKGCTKCAADDWGLKLVETIIACPDGVERMSAEVPGLVETSNNLAMVLIKDGKFYVKTLMRSSVDSAKEALADRFTCVFGLAGIPTTFTGGYSGWAPNSHSKIKVIMQEVYRKLYGKEPAVMAIHAGLECGILGGTYPNLDMISFGPTLLSPHSPGEAVNIATVGKAWEFL
ncbi:MAG: aminoacyl-histidine dipeptidase, partial [Bacteroidales bacterium]|nr:aminoacyl-histidine dipeptidase [Bacteroidales bacterium]